MSSKLRDEYKKEKQRKDKIVTEAAYAWVENNIILINEKIDSRQVKRLISSIGKFEEVFGPYKTKLPALGQQLDTAEQGLEKVVTGRANDKKASDMLKRLSFLFSSFSGFFSKDLPVLLDSHLFSAPKANPQVRLDVLQPKQGERYNPGAIRDALKHALEPSKDDLKLLRKIYRGKVPLVDAAALSAQMLQMSFNELEELTQMGKVPMVDTEAPPAAPEEAEPAPPPVEEAEAPKEGVVNIAGESVDRTQKKDSVLLESHKLLTEINQENMAKLVNVMNQLKASFNIPGMESINQAVNATVSKAQKELAANQWLQGQAAKQLLGFYNVMDNLNQLWPQIQQTFGDVGPEGQLSPDQESNLFKLLTSATKDSVFGKMAKAMKLSTPHAPGLEPNSLVNAIVDASKQQGGIENVSKLFQKSQGMPNTDPSGAPKLGGQAQAAKPTGAAKAPGATKTPDQAQDPTGTQGSAPGGTEDEAAEVMKATGMDKAGLEKLQTQLRQANYKIVKA